MYEIKGNTFDVNIDLDAGHVKIGNILLTDNIKEVRLFQMAYAMGREHKKQEIKMSLGV